MINKKEYKTVEAMIRLFCRKQHHTESLCDHCTELLEYAKQRLEKCPFGNKKPTCSKCHIHCYSPEMRERITEVMRFSGPRMILHHPIMAIRHLLHVFKPQPKNRNKNEQ